MVRTMASSVLLLPLALMVSMGIASAADCVNTDATATKHLERCVVALKARSGALALDQCRSAIIDWNWVLASNCEPALKAAAVAQKLSPQPLSYYRVAVEMEKVSALYFAALADVGSPGSQLANNAAVYAKPTIGMAEYIAASPDASEQVKNSIISLVQNIRQTLKYEGEAPQVDPATTFTTDDVYGFIIADCFFRALHIDFFPSNVQYVCPHAVDLVDDGTLMRLVSGGQQSKLTPSREKVMEAIILLAGGLIQWADRNSKASAHLRHGMELVDEVKTLSPPLPEQIQIALAAYYLKAKSALNTDRNSLPPFGVRCGVDVPSSFPRCANASPQPQRLPTFGPSASVSVIWARRRRLR